jgi:hypothetical protein
MRMRAFVNTLLLACLWQAANAQTVDPFYSGSYSVTSLGSITGVPPKYGGMVFKDANTLWVSGQATNIAGRYYSVPVTRGPDNHIVSLGSGTVLGFGNFNDGGIAFGPGGVLFYTEYPGNSIGEVVPPNYSADFRTIGLTALGVAPSVGALGFVPAGYNGAGEFKVVSHDTNGIYTIPLTSDGSGGYDLGNATLVTTLNTCSGTCGSEGFVYVPLGSPLFSAQSMLVTEYFSNTVGSYLIDADGNPVPSSRRNFINGLTGAQCAVVDPLTGDVIFATFGSGNQVILVRGFGPGAPSGSMAHLAAQENWTTTFTLVNKGTSSAETLLSFFGDLADPSGNGPLTLSLTFPQEPAAPVPDSVLNQTISANASLIVTTAGPQTPPVLVGSAQLASTGAVDGFAIFHQILTTQEAVVPMETRNAGSYLLAFDNTDGLVLGVAVDNVSAQNAVIPVIIRDDGGNVISSPGTAISLGGSGHTSFVLSDPDLGFPVTASIRGTIEFDTPPGGQISVLGLRFTPPNNSLTTIPALANVGTGGGSIAHLASGGDGWQTTFVLVNTGTSPAQASLSFFNDQTGTPLSLPMTFPQGFISPTTAPAIAPTLAAGSTLIIVSGGVTPQLLTGSAQLSTTGNVSGFVIFRHNGQEAVVPLESRNANSYVVAFDNTNGTATGVALNVVSALPVNVPVVVRDDNGTQIVADLIAMAPNGHYAFTLGTDRYPGALTIRGTIEFVKPANAQIGALGIRIPTGAAHTYTTLPALAK